MHKLFELLLNDVVVPMDDPEFLGHDRDRDAFAHFRIDMYHLQPVRTELSRYYTNSKSGIVCAGQADCVFRDRRDGKPVIVDFKRTNKDLSASNTGKNGFAPKHGIGVFNDVISNEHHRYSVQQSVYALMYEQLTGEHVKSCYLLQINPDNPQDYEFVKCSDHRERVKAVLDDFWIPPQASASPAAADSSTA